MEKKEGNIFFIPLFLPTDIKDNIKNYGKYKFPQSETYAFGRLIEIDQSGGDLVEIFNYIGNIPDEKETIVKSGLLMKPVHISLGFSKKRWRFVFEDENYDKNRNSDYQNISFLLGTPENPQLWQGGKKSEISDFDTQKYSQWIVYPSTQLENLIKRRIDTNRK